MKSVNTPEPENDDNKPNLDLDARHVSEAVHNVALPHDTAGIRQGVSRQDLVPDTCPRPCAMRPSLSDVTSSAFEAVFAPLVCPTVVATLSDICNMYTCACVHTRVHTHTHTQRERERERERETDRQTHAHTRTHTHTN